MGKKRKALGILVFLAILLFGTVVSADPCGSGCWEPKSVEDGGG